MSIVYRIILEIIRLIDLVCGYIFPLAAILLTLSHATFARLAVCVVIFKTRKPKRIRQITLTSITRRISLKGKTIIELHRVNLIIRFDSNVNCISRYSSLIFASRRNHIESRTLTISIRQIKKYQRRGYKYSMAYVRERVKVAATALARRARP